MARTNAIFAADENAVDQSIALPSLPVEALAKMPKPTAAETNVVGADSQAALTIARHADPLFFGLVMCL